MRIRRWAGFTLIEVLVVVAIVGIVVAIGVVNYLNAIERARQRRSMADMRGISTAIEAYAADLDRYPPASAFVLPAGLGLPTESLAATQNYLQPTYIRTLPLVDGWNSWFTYGVNASRADYVLRSNGRGGLPQTDPLYEPTTDFRDDIILVNGRFVQWPDGVQH
ncbi:MAG TPA: type II secretion system protein GspG [Thermoanaerobaculia bacterium]|nr:type II secretion system protein GspG [Thermoanaerobaculia bacterium]